MEDKKSKRVIIKTLNKCLCGERLNLYLTKIVTFKMHNGTWVESESEAKLDYIACELGHTKEV